MNCIEAIQFLQRFKNLCRNLVQLADRPAVATAEAVRTGKFLVGCPTKNFLSKLAIARTGTGNRDRCITPILQTK
ncbi:MAG: hypothetical protein KME15_25655 [Drouetiella hepatica Uher 2000/2452]|jgi:hypothetical protein|uniref:Uncharacterized protein n=1 Tax=Drouetiella hepatica Uher 2000/2452 TaxID=904376 RepID=A0A951QIW1_9CYAN|nr:hypothetical protein [Drouetiella hepatica Uher 2000/2452]